MLARLLHRVTRTAHTVLQALRRCLLATMQPAAPVVLAGALADLARSTPVLVAENALLRQQLIVLKRSVKRPRCTPADRTLLVLLASRVRLSHPHGERGLRAVSRECVARMPGPSLGPGRGTPATHPAGIRGVLQHGATAPGPPAAGSRRRGEPIASTGDRGHGARRSGAGRVTSRIRESGLSQGREYADEPTSHHSARWRG